MKAQFCTECGAALDEKGHCQNPSCSKKASTTAASSKASDIISEAKKKRTTFSEKGKLIVPDCIKCDQDEVPIKQYDIARLQTLIKGAFAEGRLQVTNKRILFRSSGNSVVGPTSIQHEFSIEEIAGVEIRKESRFNFLSTLLLTLLTIFICSKFQPVVSHIYNSNFLGFIFMLLLAATAPIAFLLLKGKAFIRHVALSFILACLPMRVSDIVSTITGQDNLFITLIQAIVVVFFFGSLIPLAFAPNLVVNIKTKGGTPSVEIRRKDGFFSFHHNEYTGFSQIMPGPDVDLAMHELGAVIREVQQTGTYNENK